MPRKAGRAKPAIGRAEGEGMPTNAKYQNRNGLTSGGVGQIRSMAVSKLKLVNGELSTWPTYNPVFPNKPWVTAIETNPNLNLSQGGNTSPQFAMLQDVMAEQYGLLTDNLARKYANAQNLQLTTVTHFSNYLGHYANVFANVYPLITLLNGDGFNKRMATLAIAGTQYRSRVQTLYSRLQAFPIVPGLVDILRRCVGAVASHDGGDVLFPFGNTGGTGTPPDLSLPAGWATVVSNAETEITNLDNLAEQGLIRIVLAEYYGDPTPLPYDGVKVCRGLYELIRLMSVWKHGAAGPNIFAAPTWENDNGTTNNFMLSVPVIVPRGYTDDPLWASLWRPAAWSLYNNVTFTGHNFPMGLTYVNPGVDWTIGIYYDTAINVNDATLNTAGIDETSYFSNFYWAFAPAAERGDWATFDVRVQEDMELFYASPDLIAQNTSDIMRDMISGKVRYNLPGDCTNWTAGTMVQRA